MSQPQAHLWVGNNDYLLKKAAQFLSKKFCLNKSSTSCCCIECRKLREGQHSQVLWINPQKNYYITEDIEIIFEKTSFQLNEHEDFYFILNKAEGLGAVCSNKLLKTLEEPPKGYNFLLLSNNLNSILPTIRSRCIIEQSKLTFNENSIHPLLKYFIKKEMSNSPIEFDSELKKASISEQDSLQLINELFAYFSGQFINNTFNPEVTEKIEHIKEAMKKPPQPGGSNLFWKNLYLSFPR